MFVFFDCLCLCACVFFVYECTFVVSFLLSSLCTQIERSKCRYEYVVLALGFVSFVLEIVVLCGLFDRSMKLDPAIFVVGAAVCSESYIALVSSSHAFKSKHLGLVSPFKEWCASSSSFSFSFFVVCSTRSNFVSVAQYKDIESIVWPWIIPLDALCSFVAVFETLQLWFFKYSSFFHFALSEPFICSLLLFSAIPFFFSFASFILRLNRLELITQTFDYIRCHKR